MSTIICKAKRADQNVWVFGYFVEFPNEETVIYSTRKGEKHLVKKETRCRAIDTIDKNGDPLFVGDIINDFSGGAWIEDEENKVVGQALPPMICKGDNTRIGIVEEEGTIRIRTKELNYSYNISKASPFTNMELVGNIHD